MKKFKAIVPALAMLLVSAVLLGTSTFAWFSMNDDVTVSGLQITAKSDQVYLIVGGSNDLGTLQGQAEKDSYTFNTGNTAALKPVQPKTTITGATSDYITVAGTAGNWQYKIANASSSANSSSEAKNVETLGEYVLSASVYLTLQKGSVPAENLVVTNANFTVAGSVAGAGNTVTHGGVIIAGADGLVCKQTGTELDTTKAIVNEITDAKVVEVKIFVYINGEDASVYTDNFKNLDGLKLDLEFKVSPKAE